MKDEVEAGEGYVVSMAESEEKKKLSVSDSDLPIIRRWDYFEDLKVSTTNKNNNTNDTVAQQQDEPMLVPLKEGESEQTQSSKVEKPKAKWRQSVKLLTNMIALSRSHGSFHSSDDEGCSRRTSCRSRGHNRRSFRSPSRCDRSLGSLSGFSVFSDMISDMSSSEEFVETGATDDPWNDSSGWLSLEDEEKTQSKLMDYERKEKEEIAVRQQEKLSGAYRKLQEEYETLKTERTELIKRATQVKKRRQKSARELEAMESDKTRQGQTNQQMQHRKQELVMTTLQIQRYENALRDGDDGDEETRSIVLKVKRLQAQRSRLQQDQSRLLHDLDKLKRESSKMRLKLLMPSNSPSLEEGKLEVQKDELKGKIAQQKQLLQDTRNLVYRMRVRKQKSSEQQRFNEAIIESVVAEGGRLVGVDDGEFEESFPFDMARELLAT